MGAPRAYFLPYRTLHFSWGGGEGGRGIASFSFLKYVLAFYVPATRFFPSTPVMRWQPFQRHQGVYQFHSTHTDTLWGLPSKKALEAACLLPEVHPGISLHQHYPNTLPLWWQNPVFWSICIFLSPWFIPSFLGGVLVSSFPIKGA